MDLDTLIAHWSGTVPPNVRTEGAARCAQPRCLGKVAIKSDGTPAKSCFRCLKRRAASCRRRRAALVAEGGCRRCGYRKRLENDFLCQRCRDDRDRERAQKRQDAHDAAVIDDFAAQPDRVHKAGNLDIGVSPWNARGKREATAAYWSPLPAPATPHGCATFRHAVEHGKAPARDRHASTTRRSGWRTQDVPGVVVRHQADYQDPRRPGRRLRGPPRNSAQRHSRGPACGTAPARRRHPGSATPAHRRRAGRRVAHTEILPAVEISTLPLSATSRPVIPTLSLVVSHGLPRFRQGKASTAERTNTTLGDMHGTAWTGHLRLTAQHPVNPAR